MSTMPARGFFTTIAGLLAGLALIHCDMVYASETGKRIAEQGAANASAVACATCHGADGGGDDVSGFPRLAGLNAAYLQQHNAAPTYH